MAKIDMEKTTPEELFEQFVVQLDKIMPPKMTVPFSLSEEGAKLTGSRVGGVPWVPEGASIPIDDEGYNMALVFQINFEEMPHLEGFPECGMLQMFIEADDDDLGANFDDLTNQERWRLMWHDHVEQSEEDAVGEDSPFGSYTYPFRETFRIVFSEPEIQRIQPIDCRFEGAAAKAANELLGTNYNSFWDVSLWDEEAFSNVDDNYVFDDEDIEDIGDYICEKLSSEGNRIGGYPIFNQDYSGCESCYVDYNELLFELDNEKLSRWYACATANLFISSADLANKNFTNVIYFYDYN